MLGGVANSTGRLELCAHGVWGSVYSETSLNGLPFMRKPLYCAQFTRNGTHRRIMPIHFVLSIAETSAFRIANEICIPYIV